MSKAKQSEKREYVRQYTLKPNDPEKVQWLDVHWFQEEQALERRQSFEDPIMQFPQSFAKTGWTLEGNSHLVELTAEERAMAVQQRVAYVEMLYKRAKGEAVNHPPGTPDWAVLPGEVPVDIPETREGERVEKTTVNLKTVADWLVSIGFTEAANAPRYKGNSTYRRGYALPVSVYAWLTGGRADESRKHDAFVIIGTLVEYGKAGTPEAMERATLDRLQENRMEGRAKYSDVDYVASAAKLVAQGYSESRLSDACFGASMRTTKRGIVQRLHPLAVLANRHPQLNIVERVTRSAPTTVVTDANGKERTKVIENPPYEPNGWLPFSRLNAADLRTLKGGGLSVSPSDLAKRAFVEVTGSYAAGQEASAEVVEHYFRLLFSEAKTAIVRPMSKTDIEGIATNAAQGTPTRALLDAVLGGKGQAAVLSAAVTGENAILAILERAPKGSIVAKTAHAVLKRDAKALERLLDAEATSVSTEVETSKRNGKRSHARR